MHADPESPASREEAHLLPDSDWLKVKPAVVNGNLSPGIYYPTASKRFVDERHPVPSPTDTHPYCFAFVRLPMFCVKSFTLESYSLIVHISDIADDEGRRCKRELDIHT